ncbi:hypothetical protein ANN_15105 [Periplaneta americana]|uniref:Outer dynein arm-docking complex subunit 4 n=1 Tax=Periplaneta americana TaxID=6978 RepID=A0ABQ8SYT3_PERAM|nr:hypothetical protein ANN_15105 [Periplaneta americana]
MHIDCKLGGRRKRPLERPRRRWEDNIKMDLREVGYDDRDWINLAQDRDRCRAYVRTAMNLRALELNPKDKNALVARSKCYLLLGEPQLALKDAETALHGDKNFIHAIYQKAESLYNLGDFEHSLMYYHRGLHLRPELEGFRLGVQKAQEAIENTIGKYYRAKQQQKANYSLAQDTNKTKQQMMMRMNDRNGNQLPQAEESNTGSTESNGSAKRASSCRKSEQTSQISKQQSRRLLGELCVDKEYLEQFLKHPGHDKKSEVGVLKSSDFPFFKYAPITSCDVERPFSQYKNCNKVLRKIFGAKRDEVTGEWRKLHNAELHALYSSPDIIRNIKSRRLRWAEHVARMGESRNAYRVLVGRPEGKRPLGKPRRRWEHNIKMDLKEVGYDGRDWINLAQDRDQWRAYVRAAMNLRVL